MRALAVAVSALFAIGCCTADDLCYADRQSFFRAHQDSLEAFAADLRSYGRIVSMSNGSRYFIELNGYGGQLDSTAASTTSELQKHRFEVFAPVFRRDAIAPADYEHFRERLVRLGFVKVAIYPDYTAFLYDAFIDNGNGFLYVLPGRQPPAERAELFDMSIVVLEELAPRWYFFGTS